MRCLPRLSFTCLTILLAPLAAATVRAVAAAVLFAFALAFSPS
ncbi:MAG: hypothetical protein V7607_5260 [Solirubrobacteraceae bacterium]